MGRLHVRVTPKASRESIGGWREGALLVRVTAAPEAGKANAAVCKVVASALGVPKSSVSVVRGASSRHKTLDIATMSAVDIEAALGGTSR